MGARCSGICRTKRRRDSAKARPYAVEERRELNRVGESGAAGHFCRLGLGLENDQKLRVDTTVVQTDIHHHTDDTLLWDVVRVLTRLIGRLAAALSRRRIKGFRDRTPLARRLMQELQRMTTRQRQEQQTGKYRELIGIAEEVLQSARTALRNTRKSHGKDMLGDRVIAETRKEIEHFCELGSRVINQSRRRVLNGEQVPTAEKRFSIVEPHTDIIKRGKVQTPIEFGHRVFLAESAPVLINQYEVLDDNPVDETVRRPFKKNATSKPSAALPNCMAPIAGSSASAMWHRANRMVSRW
jgi:hypothetical protein